MIIRRGTITHNGYEDFDGLNEFVYTLTYKSHSKEAKRHFSFGETPPFKSRQMLFNIFTQCSVCGMDEGAWLWFHVYGLTPEEVKRREAVVEETVKRAFHRILPRWQLVHHMLRVVTSMVHWVATPLGCSRCRAMCNLVGAALYPQDLTILSPDFQWVTVPRAQIAIPYSRLYLLECIRKYQLREKADEDQQRINQAQQPDETPPRAIEDEPEHHVPEAVHGEAVGQ